MGLLDGKTVVVSGVGPGLGREIAEAAAREGANVIIGARTEANLRAAADGIDPTGERVAWRVTDITNGEHCDALIALAVDRFGGLDSLVNCAAFDTAFGGLKEPDWDAWRTTFEVNVFGTMRITAAAIAPLEQRGGGSIVFIGSQATYWPQVPQLAYASSKGALNSAMYYLAKELGPSKIRVNTVVPSWMWGPPVEGYVNMTAKAQGVSPDDVKAGIANQMMLQEIPTDGDIAESVVFMASDRATMITGQALMVNAGDFLR